MIYYSIGFFVAALSLILINPKSVSNRWLVCFLICGGLGGVADIIKHGLQTGGFNAFAYIGIHVLNEYVTPYATLMFSLVYSDKFKPRTHKILAISLFIPVLLMIGALPSSNNLVLLLIWISPYYMATCFFLIHGVIHESYKPKKINRLITALIIVPTVISTYTFYNIFLIFQPDFDYFRYISVFLAYSFGLSSLLLLFGQGAFGIKLRFEKDVVESTRKAISSGTALLNHTIKNEITKISLCTNNLHALTRTESSAIHDQLDVITRSTQHMLDMVQRIQHQIQDIIVVEKPTFLIQLIEDSILTTIPIEAEHKITITRMYTLEIELWCDPVHMKEVLNNLIKNAVEAMNHKGQLILQIKKYKKGILLSIHDNGSGIHPDNMRYIFDPFFSTKKNHTNFGLGLTYCHHVMMQSGGSLKLESNSSNGTTAFLLFPYKKIIQEREILNGTN
jgi:signal transduction histidine kinase